MVGERSTSLTLLGGGTGTPKLLWDPDGAVAPDELVVVANTGDDVEFGDLFVCPDVDACLFAAAGRIDTGRWWGLAGDTTTVADALTAHAGALGLDDEARFRPADAQETGRPLARWRRFDPLPEFMTLGDEDRAIHRVRAAALDRGWRLTDITRDLGDALGASVPVLPMSDEPVATLVQTEGGLMHFQEYWVARRGAATVEAVEFRGAEDADPTGAVLEALAADRVVIGPSNPVTSLGPILALDGVRDALDAVPVVAVSPFIGDTAFSGPAVDLMAATGLPAGTAGLTAAYPFVDAVVLDAGDRTAVDRPTVRTDIRVDRPDDAGRVWSAIDEAFGLLT